MTGGLLLAAAPAGAYEGFGAVTNGAASCPTGAATYHVTSLADSGAGSLRDAISVGCRNIVFDVGGTITLNSQLRVRVNYLTINGASAPSPGITISQPTLSAGVVIESGSSGPVHDIVVHHLRHVGPGGHDDSIADIWGLDGEENPVYNVVLDHITAKGSNDGVFDVWGTVHDVTISWNLISDTVAALHFSEASTTRQRISLHHNVFARNNERQIRLRYQNGVVDFVNNVVYGWGWVACSGAGLEFAAGSANDNEWPKINIENNYYLNVPGTPCGGGNGAIDREVTGKIYFSGNTFPPQETDTASSSPRHALPPSAEVTKFAASTLGNTVVPCVGTVFPTAAETTLLQQVGVAVGGSGAACTAGGPLPTMAVDDVAVVEGDAGTTPASFTVSLSAASAQPVTVNYATGGGSASAGTDYQAATGILTFTPGALTRPLVVNVVGDVATETDESFVVTLSSPANATLTDGQGEGLIGDDDAASMSSLELTHGSRVATDLSAQSGVPGEHSYRLFQAARASYEVIVDAGSGGAQPLSVQRLASDNLTVLQSGLAVGTGRALSLKWENTSVGTVGNQSLRVRGACAGACGVGDRYRLRFYETTYASPRFNNAGSQQTVLIVQNVTSSAVSGHAYFWSPAGSLLATQTLTFGPRQLVTVQTAGLAPLAGRSGTVTLAHTGPYGALAGKTVAVEPASGFSFDAPLLPRSR